MAPRQRSTSLGGRSGETERRQRRHRAPGRPNTLYFEADNEDSLRKVGYSKERRVDPQIVVGLLVDRAGFPLEIGCFEGNKAEKHTIVPIIEAFKARHGIEHMAVVADAGMLSAANLTALDDAGYKFIVGSRQSKASIDLESHFRWHALQRGCPGGGWAPPPGRGRGRRRAGAVARSLSTTSDGIGH
jgi:hypothetical protein